MNRHDRAWRIAGFVLIAAGYAVPLAGDPWFARAARHTVIVLVGMPLALAGALLMVQGDRVIHSPARRGAGGTASWYWRSAHAGAAVRN